MKIAIVTNILTPYRAVFFHKLSNELTSQGDNLRVYVMCKEKADRPWKYDDLKTDYTEVIKGFKFRIHGIYVYFNNPFKQLKAYSPDIVVCAGSYWLPTTLKVLHDKKKLHYRTFMWSESHEKEVKNNSWLRRFLSKVSRKYSLSRFDGFLYASVLAKSFVAKYASPHAFYIPLPNTVNQDEFQKAYARMNNCRKELKIPSEHKVIFTAARLSPEKGIINFLNLFSKVKNNNTVTIIVAGIGPLKNEIDTCAKGLNISLKLLGQKSQDEIIELLALSDIFLLPSLSDPNPLTVIEALWAGKPLLISDGVGNQNEAVISGVNGYVYSYSREDEATEIIETMINNSNDWYLNASNVSHSIAEQVYDINKVVSNLITSLKSITK